MVQKFFIGVLAGGIFLLGIFGGMIAQKILQSEQKAQDIVIKNFAQTGQETKGLVPVITLQKIENGVMYGQVNGGEVRIMVGELAEDTDSKALLKDMKNTSIEVLPGGNFSFNTEKILPMLQMIPHPAGKNFVASKRGTRYWALDTPQAFLLSQKNRIFFETKEEAQEKGFKRGER